MRIQLPNLDRPKQAAKYLVRAATNLKLSYAHEALASVLGYRDWHDLSGSCHHDRQTSPGDLCLEDALRVILELADALRLPYAEVQYAVSKARLLRETPWSLDEQMTLRAWIWRRRLFGPPGRGRPGTVVKDKAYGANTPAYLRRAGRPTYLFFDTGFGERADFEVVTPRRTLSDFVPSRLWLPYGVWKLKDGSEVIFSRDYFPTWGIWDDRVQRLAPWLWINGIVDQSHFWKAGIGGWTSSSAREMAIAHLAVHRIFELPRLTDAMPHLFEAAVDSMEDGVRRLYAAGRRDTTLPSYAELNKRILR
ncbi:hypothetical protein ABIE78_000022 [Sinorhizobium fredii]|uniref:Uncharacterized protein n=2 Tax=Rhizobium fredii TaxID=380 RepID=I3XG99_SINF2|nr:hypothetical protein [Sinorhizobium fredii]AFL54905.1 hypothetical protein USDA257_p01900 [Sinorhizobium fredii USDA 257]KSV90127.1 hypothetical protein N181_13005 [Sinorhizobium fredii USDA 205]MQX07580.1 hypothetical protein [Sinorhizobium fredii]CCE99185.1 hypothetical protein SFHH103_04712 [Sinorhizobium fredii HH103]CEO91207.1 hypothetical protein predicted by Glimmer/Critica [Sinorhizobium fredii HH103]